MKIKAQDIAQMASPADVIFDALRQAITNGTLVEGAVLRQDAIAKLFNVSRIPVREALTRLEEQGLISTKRYRGAIVAPLSFAEIEEIFEFRALVESQLIRFAVPHLTEASRHDARRFAEAFAATGDPTQWGELNRMFHYTLYRDSHRPYTLQVVDTALIRIERYQRVQLTLTDGMARAKREHDGILQACLDGDPDGAASRTRDHLLGACKSLIDILKETRPIQASAT